MRRVATVSGPVWRPVPIIPLGLVELKALCAEPVDQELGAAEVAIAPGIVLAHPPDDARAMGDEALALALRKPVVNVLQLAAMTGEAVDAAG